MVGRGGSGCPTGRQACSPADVVEAYAPDHVGRATGVYAVSGVDKLNISRAPRQCRRPAISEPTRKGSGQADPDTVHLSVRADHDARSARGAVARVVEEVSDIASRRVVPVGRYRARKARNRDCTRIVGLPAELKARKIVAWGSDASRGLGEKHARCMGYKLPLVECGEIR
jgi:hypothetical protein